MRARSRKGWQAIALAACLSLLACQREQTRTADRGERAEHSRRVFSTLDRAKALETARRLIEQENARVVAVGAKWSLPVDVQALPLAAATVDGVGTLVYVAASQGLVTGELLPALPVSGQTAGGTVQDRFFIFNGLFSTSVVLQVQARGLFRLVNDQWKADSSVPTGTYRWFLGRAGVYLRDTQAGDTRLLLAFDSPGEGPQMAERHPVGLSVEGQGGETLVMNVGAKKLRFR